MIDRLIEAVEKKKNPTVAGLNPRIEFIPGHLTDEAFGRYGRNLEGAAEALWQFNRRIIDSVYDVIPAVKLQSAYYEMYGWEGMRAFKRTAEYAKKMGLFVIADIKCGDRAGAAAAYADAYLGNTDIGMGIKVPAFNTDAVTVSPYFGEEGLKPFIDTKKTVFIAVKALNKEEDRVLEEKIAKLGETSRGTYGYSNIGALIEASTPEGLSNIRRKMPCAYFMITGYGVQGANAESVAGAFDRNGAGAVVSASRSIMYSYINNKTKPEGFDAAARAEVLNMRTEIRKALKL